MWRVVGLLAVARVGAAYVAVEPSEPALHAADLWHRADVAVVLADTDVDGFVGFRWVPIAGPVLGDAGPVTAPVSVGGGAEAAVHFTSGSTGGPKGVAATHRGIVARVLIAEFASLGPGDVVAHLSPISFDPAVLEIWGALLNGATVAVIAERPPSPDRLARLIRDHGVTVAFLTTALFERIVDLRPDALAPLRRLLVGGEVLPVGAAAAFLAHAPQCQLLNCYGPTENTIVCTWFPVDTAACAAGVPLPIGRPVAASTAHVLDAAGRLVPAGVEGELHLGGDGLALGYVNDQQRTADRFVRRRPNGRDEVLLYRTGDRAYVDNDGVLHFRGRTDDQVKVRGVRIEPAAVEAALAGCDGVAQVTVVVREWGSRPGRRVVAYVVAASGTDPDAMVFDVQRFARERLGSHACPSAVVVLDEMPLGPTGKVDRAALPDPIARSGGGSFVGTELERKVHDQFVSVLDCAQVGLDDDFFDLGGDSLRSLDLVHRIERRFGVTLSVAQFFAEPTVAGVCRAPRHGDTEHRERQTGLAGTPGDAGRSPVGSAGPAPVPGSWGSRRPGRDDPLWACVRRVVRRRVDPRLDGLRPRRHRDPPQCRGDGGQLPPRPARRPTRRSLCPGGGVYAVAWWRGRWHANSVRRASGCPSCC